MKKKDIWIILAVLGIALAGIFFIQSNKDDKTETLLRITVSGKEYKVVPLTAKTNDTFNVETDLGLNKIRIKDGVVSIYEADCPDQICVHNMPIDEVGEMIVCLPNQVIAEIVSNN